MIANFLKRTVLRNIKDLSVWKSFNLTTRLSRISLNVVIQVKCNSLWCHFIKSGIKFNHLKSLHLWVYSMSLSLADRYICSYLYFAVRTTLHVGHYRTLELAVIYTARLQILSIWSRVNSTTISSFWRLGSGVIYIQSYLQCTRND